MSLQFISSSSSSSSTENYEFLEMSLKENIVKKN